MTIDPPKKLSIKEDLWLVAELAWAIGWIVAVPAVLFGFGGAWLDKYLESSPLFIILGFAIAVSLSGWGIYRKVREILR